MGSDNDRIEIALASDGGYAAGLMVSAVSIAAFASKSARLSFTFVDGGFSDSFYEELTQRINAVHPLAETRRVRLDATRFASFREWRGNKVAYARFLLPELLPDASHVVYCDVDTLWLADISDLWSQRDAAAAVLAVRDPDIDKMREREWFESRGFKYDGARYFNSGVMLINLDLFRKNRLAERAYEILSKFPDSLFADQGPLNIVAGDSLKLLDDRWMRFTLGIASEDFASPIVCHYANDVPWEKSTLVRESSDSRMAWHFFRAGFCGRKVGWRRSLLYFATRNRILGTALRTGLRLFGRRAAAKLLERAATCDVRRVVQNPRSEHGTMRAVRDAPPGTRKFGRLRQSICGSAAVRLLSSRVDVALLSALLLGVFIQGCLFLAGVACSPWPMWISFSAVALALLVDSGRSALLFLLYAVACLVLTAFTFSYAGSDAVAYHFPMQDLLRHGWNPVRVATVEGFRELLGGLTALEIHVLFLPRLNALCGALVGLSTGLFVADSFLSYALIFVLLSTARDFARRFWRLGGAMSALFAFSLAFTTKFTAFLSGYVDYLTYAGAMVMLMSAALYLTSRRASDLLPLFAAIVVSSLAKSTGLVTSVLLSACLLPLLWKDRGFWLLCVASAAYVAIVGYSPLITSWVNYGCPLYPTMSWSALHPPIDITSDFSGNADALRMGYLARSLYAWVSPALAVKLCSFIYGKPDFNPVFTVFDGVDGFGSGFRWLLLAGAMALAASKKNVVAAVCGFIVVTALVVPLKYIGYSRYFPQMWAIPVFALFNLAAFPCCVPGRPLLARAFRMSCVALPVMVAMLCAVRSLAFCGRSLAVEAGRQRAIAELKGTSGRWRYDGEKVNTYSLVRRLSVAGVDCDAGGEDKPGLPSLSYDRQHMWVSAGNAREEAAAMYSEFFVVNSVGSILRFPWRRAFSSRPSVLWYGF